MELQAFIQQLITDNDVTIIKSMILHFYAPL